jgi:glycogen debranching enzyme
MSTDVAATANPAPPVGPKGPYYIQAPSPMAEVQSRVLKQGDTFAVFDHHGDINPQALGQEGIYHEGTRFLSCLLLEVDHYRPLFLSSTIKDDNDVLAVDLTNPDVSGRGELDIARGQLHIDRLKFLREGVCHERLSVHSYQLAPARVRIAFRFEADFADIFEVRGTPRALRGEYLEPVYDGGSVVLAYRGLDQVTRRTRLRFKPAPAQLTGDTAVFELVLPPQGQAHIHVAVCCERDGLEPAPDTFDEALFAAGSDWQSARGDACRVETSNERFNDWVNRAAADLHMMTTRLPTGPYPYAGVPWFSTPFGRDGIITALQVLWLEPALARGVLAYLAATQATEVVPEQDAQPGKILHETRGGEMAALGEVPFGRYYGSVDATPLFVYLAGAYYERTADRAFIAAIWPNLEAALGWIDHYGDADGDGLVEYARTTPHGLVHQGWKDSHDAIFHADGRPAEPPIALCEVQGYVYAARLAGARLAEILGHADRAEQLRHQAWDLRANFEHRFWCEDLSTYALALDGAKRPCRVRSSNAGQCLFTGIAEPAHAHRVAQTLLHPDSFSGWGVRTIAVGEARYNPMSYHNGSVWPHDNSLIASGLAHYRLKKPVLEILTGQFDASLFMELHRLPELFCGFARRPGTGPTLYPVACSPQAWAAATVFLLIQSCLGLSVRGTEPQVHFSFPLLPPFLREVRILNLRVGEAAIDLLLQRHGQDVGINVLRREGHLEVHMVK